jgi:phosphohistidine phosphatase SixA
MEGEPQNVYWSLKQNDVGIRVIPCYEKDGKLKPATKWKDKREMDTEDYEEWLENYDWTEADGIGFILPDDIVGLDIDCKGGVNGAKEIQSYLEGQGIEPERIKKAPKVRTANGGYHYYFRENGEELRKKTGVLDGVDIQAGRSGALLFAPPSTKDGGAYEWEDGRDLITQPLPKAPDWLKKLAKDDDESNTRDDLTVDTDAVSPAKILNGVSKGQRNEKLFRYACRLRSKDYEINEAEVLLQTAAANCEPAYPSEGEESPKEMVKRVWKEYDPADERLDDVQKIEIDEDKQSLVEGAKKLSDWVESRHVSDQEYPEENIRTGIEPLDHVTNAIEPGEFVVIGGEPKTGKTTLAIQILTESTAKHDNQGLLVSLEMDVEDVLLKIAHCQIKANMNSTIKGSQLDNQKQIIRDYFDTIAERTENNENQIKISTPGEITVHEFCEIVRSYHDEHDIDFAMLDYFQFLSNPEPEIYSLNDYLSDASKRIRELSLDLNIPIFVISRQNKSGTTYGTSAVAYDMTTGIKIRGEKSSTRRYINADRVRLAPGGTIEAELIGSESRFADFHLQE